MPLIGHQHLCKIPKPHKFFKMSTEASTKIKLQNGPQTLQNYPVPLSPPPPLISKDLEVHRALTASSKSALFSLSKNDVVFEDEWLIAVNKPHGVYCESILSSAHSFLSVEQGKQVNLQELHLSNRLDRDTSGVTIITKSHKVAAKLVKAFTDHKVKKTYIASCVGTVPKWDTIILKSGHGRSKHGAWRVYALTDVGRTLPGGSSIRDMETLFEVISVNGKGRVQELSGLEKQGEKVVIVEEKSEVTNDVKRDEVVVRARPRNGRTHQIRLHCQYLGIPIKGDVKYEGVYEWKDRKYEGHELHAESLSFEHPVTGQPLLIRAPLPSWASQALDELSTEMGSRASQALDELSTEMGSQQH